MSESSIISSNVAVGDTVLPQAPRTRIAMENRAMCLMGNKPYGWQAKIKIGV
jgi:hypothetical protein